MSHLDLESLARIAGETPTPDEAAHLEACADCRDELDALREQSAALASLPPPSVPDAVWSGVEARWAAERPVALASRRTRARGWILQAAAAAVVFVAGTAVGARLEPGATEAPAGEETAELYPPAVPADPETSLREAEAIYAAALSRYMAANPDAAEVDPMRRLAALESIIMTARAALDETPQDPVITGYYRAALAQREALLTNVQYEEGAWF